MYQLSLTCISHLLSSISKHVLSELIVGHATVEVLTASSVFGSEADSALLENAANFKTSYGSSKSGGLDFELAALILSLHAAGGNLGVNAFIVAVGVPTGADKIINSSDGPYRFVQMLDNIKNERRRC